ncbi:LOW QUALITY PROTEIN: hypothetical protein Cgig2_033941 [Carnegiea gigantea]|uniref:Uncharacterized protein n=1 Tax=Carnegiea gigantea TaxID=171969 RepID=A0A9Q1GS13_9CARY|nr:LOW QUALITY PROTEIN: hypothetical protein Cgig2_033941 [Carnegiea gigantea]
MVDALKNIMSIITDTITRQVQRAMEPVNAARPLPHFDYVPTTGYELSHQYAHVPSPHHPEKDREASRSNQSGRPYTGNHDRCAAAATRPSGHPVQGQTAKSTTTSTPYVTHSKQTTWLEEQVRGHPMLRRLLPMTASPKPHNARKYCGFHEQNGHTTSECHEMKTALLKLTDKGQIDHFLKKGPCFLNREREFAEPQLRDEECSTEVVATIAGGYEEEISIFIDESSNIAHLKNKNKNKINKKGLHIGPSAILTVLIFRRLSLDIQGVSHLMFRAIPFVGSPDPRPCPADDHRCNRGRPQSSHHPESLEPMSLRPYVPHGVCTALLIALPLALATLLSPSPYRYLSLNLSLNLGNFLFQLMLILLFLQHLPPPLVPGHEALQLSALSRGPYSLNKNLGHSHLVFGDLEGHGHRVGHDEVYGLTSGTWGSFAPNLRGSTHGLRSASRFPRTRGSVTSRPTLCMARRRRLIAPFPPAWAGTKAVVSSWRPSIHGRLRVGKLITVPDEAPVVWITYWLNTDGRTGFEYRPSWLTGSQGATSPILGSALLWAPLARRPSAAPSLALHKIKRSHTQRHSIVHNHGIEDRLQHLRDVGVMSMLCSHANFKTRAEVVIIRGEKVRALRPLKGVSNIFGHHLGTGKVGKMDHFPSLSLSLLSLLSSLSKS